MAKKSRYKPFKFIRIKEPVAGVAMKAADSRAQKLTHWVTEAIVSRLEREGLWPPPELAKK